MIYPAVVVSTISSIVVSIVSSVVVSRISSVVVSTIASVVVSILDFVGKERGFSGTSIIYPVVVSKSTSSSTVYIS